MKLKQKKNDRTYINGKLLERFAKTDAPERCWQCGTRSVFDVIDIEFLKTKEQTTIELHECPNCNKKWVLE